MNTQNTQNPAFSNHPMSQVNQAFNEYQQAKATKKTKSFVKYAKNIYGVDFSSRGIQANGYNFSSVYNNEQTFKAYFLQFFKGGLATSSSEPIEEPTTSGPEPFVEPIQSAVQPTQPTKQNTTKEAEQLAGLIAKLAGNAINEDRVIELIKQHGNTIEVTKYISNYQATTRATTIAVKHNLFDDLLALIGCGLNVWITGPAGSGKTHSAHQVAEVLGLPFYAKSVCAQSTQFDFLGYNDANGHFVETDFYKAYSQGGVFCLDEVDNGNANVLSVLNSALANGSCSFACGMVKKNEDFVCVATANTIGNGGNAKYVGRLAIDKATIDRFQVVEWNYDKNIELSMIGNDIEIYSRIEGLRKRAAKADLNCIISPRASVAVYKLTQAGMDIEKAFQYAIYNKLTKNELNAIL